LFIATRDLSDPRGLPLRLVVFTAVIAGFDFVGLALTRLAPHVTTLWPAKGILLAALLFSTRRNGLFLIPLAAAASIAAKLTFGEAPLFSLTTTLVSVGGSVATAFVFRAIAGTDRPDFRDWRMLALFFAIACAAATLAALPGASLVSAARGALFTRAFMGWSLATALSYLLFVPPMVLLAPPYDPAMPVSKRAILVSALAMALVTLAVFSETEFPIFYIIGMALVVVSVAAGIEAAAVGVLVTALVAVPMTLSGHWPGTYFHGQTELRLIAVQMFIVVLSIGILPAAAAVSDRNRLKHTLETMLAREREAMAAARESEERYRTLAERSKDVIVRADKQGVIRYISPGCRALGYEPAELTGVAGFTLVHPDDVASFMANTRALLAGMTETAPPVREHRFRMKNGGWMWLQGNPTVVCDAHGVPQEIVNVFRDISDRKQMDTALADATREAEAAAVAKAEFLANMSHELRTPLTSIIGFSQLLQERKDLPEPAMRYVSRVVQAGQALLALVNDILDFSKLEAGQIEIRPEPCAPMTLAADALELFTPQAKQKEIALSFKTATAIPDTLLLDEGRVRQVLLNLVGNAVKFTEAGSVTLALDYAKGKLSARVTDTGPGIPKDALGKLFQRFSQVDGSNGRTHGGTGLGLAICKGLIEAMGGEIFVESEEGKGSTFGFVIPAVREESRAPAPAANTSDALDDLKVLAADDNLANRNLLEAMLKPLGVALTLAENGTGAVKIAREQAFDVILMDVHMPDMNGADAASQIRQESRNQATPIFAFTADTGFDPKAVRNAVFDGIVHKPLTLAVLKKALRETVARAA
jgi:PAS domain S-box-containing protein